VIYFWHWLRFLRYRMFCGDWFGCGRSLLYAWRFHVVASPSRNRVRLVVESEQVHLGTYGDLTSQHWPHHVWIF
jgi:hypothetical protein